MAGEGAVLTSASGNDTIAAAVPAPETVAEFSQLGLASFPVALVFLYLCIATSSADSLLVEHYRWFVARAGILELDDRAGALV